MKRILGTASVALLAGVLSIATVVGHTVNVDSLNVRSGPGTGYSIVGTLTRGTVVNTVSTSGSWTKINSPKTGWVYSAYLSDTSHSGTTTSSGSITKAPRGNPYGLPVSRVGYLGLPSSGYGWYSYTASYRRYGLPRMINGLIQMGRHWKNGYPGSTGHTLRYGDVSLTNGGYFSPHVSHRVGEDVDMSPITTSGSAGVTSVGYSSYSTYYNTKFATLQRAVWYVELMLHNNSRIPGMTYWSGHANHFHTRIIREY